VVHEMGHNVMNNAYDSWPPHDCPSPHYINRTSGHYCGWTEGWANVFAILTNDDPNYCWPPSGTSCVDLDSDSSYTNCEPSWDCFPDGYQVEGHVAGAIWDIYDSSKDLCENFSAGYDEIWQILEDDQPDDFLEWRAEWNSHGWSSSVSRPIYQNVAYDSDTSSCCVDCGLFSDGATEPGNVCNACDTSNSLNSWTENNGASCNDQLWCNGKDYCLHGWCQDHEYSSSDPRCPDNNSWCDGEDYCNEQADKCDQRDEPECEDDGLFCNGEEFCDEDRDRCSSTGDPCPSNTTCNEQEDNCEDNDDDDDTDDDDDDN